MNDLETEMRSILSDLADEAPPSTGLVDAVHTRGRRKRRRRLTVTAAAVAVAVLAAGAVVGAVGRGEPEATLQVAEPPPKTHRGLPPAPVHLGTLPSGFNSPRVTIFDSVGWEIWSTRTKPDAQLSVGIEPTKPSGGGWPGVVSKDVTFNGRPATLITAPVNQGDSLATLRFQRKSDQWISVTVFTKLTSDPFSVVSETELRAVASGLTDEPTPVAELLRIGSVPDSLEVCGSHDGSGQEYDTSQIALCDPSVKTMPIQLNGTLPAVPDNAAIQLYWQHINGKIWRDLKSGTNRTPFEVDGREGEIAEAGIASQRRWYGWIRLTNGVVVNLEMRQPNLFTRDQVIEFLGSISPGEALK
ncbi:hypothetical protein [Cryptosporangium aurantiacum]|uniref:Uncharacterized protein n=1 Tax=Cryptosporangium aurantiacum TaxID=134849 RepID=A0A1M7R2K6_9ACTN|nr:hypothetical protein [Cryptosporangium aurantiacum]SHN38955.1 hypothetical protein SAMN05443668_106168 [Cryptosporangium aurantiacum]